MMKRLLLMFALAAMVSLAQEQAGGAPAPSEPAALWKWANFAILAIGLGYLIAKTMPAFYRSRTGEIQKSIVEAQQTKMDAERRAAEMDARLASLGSEIEKFRDRARSEMEREGERIRNETAAQIRRLEQQAAIEVESAGKAARRELRAFAAQLAVELAENRIRARLDPSAEAGMVDNFFGDLERQGSKSPSSRN